MDEIDAFLFRQISFPLYGLVGGAVQLGEVRVNLTRIYLHINIFSKGIELLEDLLEKNVKHPVMEKAAFCLMQIHKRMGNSNQAFYYLRKYNTFD